MDTKTYHVEVTFKHPNGELSVFRFKINDPSYEPYVYVEDYLRQGIIEKVEDMWIGIPPDRIFFVAVVEDA